MDCGCHPAPNPLRRVKGRDSNRSLHRRSRKIQRRRGASDASALPFPDNMKMIVRRANEPEDCSLSARLRCQNERVWCHDK
jgi:hypothetical protein